MYQAALIYSHTPSPRLQYVVDFLSGYYSQSFKLIYDEEKFIKSNEICKINYGFHRLVAGEIFILSNVLLFETTVRPVKIECFHLTKHQSVGLNQSDGYKAFFKTTGDFEFDIFAAIFFLLTRYEEYLPYKKDEFGRFPHQQSTAFREEFLHLPLINIWLEEFRFILSSKNPQLQIPKSQFQFIPTYDIDI